VQLLNGDKSAIHCGFVGRSYAGASLNWGNSPLASLLTAIFSDCEVSQVRLSAPGPLWIYTRTPSKGALVGDIAGVKKVARA
jgi:hypothetical protein